MEMIMDIDFPKKQVSTKIKYIYYQCAEFYRISRKEKWENSLSV